MRKFIIRIFIMVKQVCQRDLNVLVINVREILKQVLVEVYINELLNKKEKKFRVIRILIIFIQNVFFIFNKDQRRGNGFKLES